MEEGINKNIPTLAHQQALHATGRVPWQISMHQAIPKHRSWHCCWLGSATCCCPALTFPQSPMVSAARCPCSQQQTKPQGLTPPCTAAFPITAVPESTADFSTLLTNEFLGGFVSQVNDSWSHYGLTNTLQEFPAPPGAWSCPRA